MSRFHALGLLALGAAVFTLAGCSPDRRQAADKEKPASHGIDSAVLRSNSFDSAQTSASTEGLLTADERQQRAFAAWRSGSVGPAGKDAVPLLRNAVTDAIAQGDSELADAIRRATKLVEDSSAAR